MKKYVLYLFAAILPCMVSLSLYAQLPATNSGGEVQQMQPSIIVLPFKTSEQKYRSVLEDAQSGFEKRAAISRVKEAFDARGFTTVDFLGELKKAETASAFNADGKSNEKDEIVRNSGADIFVVVDAHTQKSPTGTTVSVILQAYETATGRSLTNKDASSGKFYTDDIAKLTTKAVDAIKEDFLNVLQAKFTEIVNNGRSIYIEFLLDPSSTKTFQSEINTDGDLLSEAISSWMAKNAYKNYAKKKGSTAQRIIYDDVRIPLKDQVTKMNYDTESFGIAIRKFFRTLNMTTSIEYPPGQISVTIK